VAFTLVTVGGARADYTGQTIDGTLAFDGGGQYWFPDTIVVPGAFFYFSLATIDTAAFNGTTLSITDEVLFPAEGWAMTFSDTAKPFTSLSLVSSDFSPALTYGLSGGEITVDWVGNEGAFELYTAVFDISGSVVPEPAPLALLSVGVLAIACVRRREG
jgi:hypothetical protein